MARWLKICLWIIGLVVYLNIGYLIAYSLDSTANQTAFSNTIYGIIDFTSYMGRPTVITARDVVTYYVVFTLLWPIIVVVSWATNFILLFWTILTWLVTGGLWRWLKLI